MFDPILFLPCLGLIKIVFAPPKEGKTYYLVKEAMEIMIRGRMVISNFPIEFWHKGRKYKSAIWDDTLYECDLGGCVIIFDEAHNLFNSREYSKFGKDKTMWFATHEHNRMDILLATHDPAMIDVNIQRCCGIYYFVRKITWPFSKRAIYFVAETYLDSAAVARRYTSKDAIYTVERYLLRKKVYRAYDFHFFRNEGKPKPDLVFWDTLGSSEDKNRGPTGLDKFLKKFVDFYTWLSKDTKRVVIYNICLVGIYSYCFILSPMMALSAVAFVFVLCCLALIKKRMKFKTKHPRPR